MPGDSSSGLNRDAQCNGDVGALERFTSAQMVVFPRVDRAVYRRVRY